MYEICLGCRSSFLQIDGPTHKYMLSSAACWKHYGDVLAREYQDPELFAAAHRLTVDAYALQHPGTPDDRRASQSVRLHYISLFLIFEYGWTHKDALGALKALANKPFDPLPSSPDVYPVTVADVWQAAEIDHVETVTRWARSAYAAWSPLHPYAKDVVSELNAN